MLGSIQRRQTASLQAIQKKQRGASTVVDAKTHGAPKPPRAGGHLNCLCALFSPSHFEEQKKSAVLYRSRDSGVGHAPILSPSPSDFPTQNPFSPILKSSTRTHINPTNPPPAAPDPQNRSMPPPFQGLPTCLPYEEVEPLNCRRRASQPAPSPIGTQRITKVDAPFPLDSHAHSTIESTAARAQIPYSHLPFCTHETSYPPPSFCVSRRCTDDTHGRA